LGNLSSLALLESYDAVPFPLSRAVTSATSDLLLSYSHASNATVQGLRPFIEIMANVPQVNGLQFRSYQSEMFERSRKANSIVTVMEEVM
jgi:hypothetical protein